MGDVVQIARSVGMKLFHGEKVKVVETIPTRNNDEWVAIVQSIGTQKPNPEKANKIS